MSQKPTHSYIKHVYGVFLSLKGFFPSMVLLGLKRIGPNYQPAGDAYVLDLLGTDPFIKTIENGLLRCN